ncbi:MAG: MBG domain-containing protein, partial [Gammaproteobacteria bacterium]|nr:MBG domain-containing protein [Gammaproteobacteria bacterium]
DPTLSGINVTLGGIINNANISTWNGTVSVNDSGNVATTLASLARAAGENVSGSPYVINAATFNALTGTAAGNYNVPTFAGSPTLSITKASLTGAIANQTKVYGANDPALSGIGVTLGGVINNPAIATWNGNVSVNDTALVSATPSSLTRAVGEIVSGSPYAITAGTFTLSGASAGNYNSPTFSGSPTLTITKASLTGTIADQTKVYGQNDPALSGINVTLNGLINNSSINTWNGNVSINDTAAVSATPSSLVRAAGEAVSNSPYAILAGTFTLLGSSANNYNNPTFVGSPVLTITPTTLSGSIANQTKVYGTNDPAASGINVRLNGVINNASVSTWNGTVSINDSNNVAASLASLNRVSGENVAGGPYSYISSVYNALTGSAAGNYILSPGLVGGAALTITPAPLVVNADAASKIYGINDPVFTYNASGFIHAIVDGVLIDDNAANSLTGALNRILVSQADENVGLHTINQGTLASSNYAITYHSDNLTITPASLTVTANGASKVYGTNDPSFTYTQVGLVNGIVDGIVINDSISGALTRTITAATENVGNYAILQGSINAGSNYSLNYVGANEAITKAPLSVNANSASKVYGVNDPGFTYGTSGFINAVVDGIVISDNATNSLTGALNRIITSQADENVGLHAINQGTLNSDNYAINYTGANEAITKAPLSVNANAANKVYGTNDPSFTYGASGFINATVDGIVIADNASNSLTGGLNRVITSQADENVGLHAINQGSLTGSNYAITYTGANETINPATLIVNANPQTKVYGTSDPQYTYTQSGLVNAVVDGITINDTINGSLTRVITPATENVGAYPILQGTLSAGSNYNLTYNSANLSITPAMLIASLTGNATKTYDATTAAFLNAGNYILSGILGGDNVMLNNPANGVYINANAGTGKNVSVSGLTLSGSAASNYQLVSTTVNGSIGIINPATLTITGVTANNKVSDGSTLASLNTSEAILNGIFAPDVGSISLSGGGTGLFASANVGNNISVTATGIPLKGTALGNYILIMPADLTADILPVTNPEPVVPVSPTQIASSIASNGSIGSYIFPSNVYTSNTSNNTVSSFIPSGGSFGDDSVEVVVKQSAKGSCVSMGMGVEMCNRPR